MKLGIISYSSSNTANVKRLFAHLESSLEVIDLIDVNDKIDFLILPGVGNFEFVINELEDRNFNRNTIARNFPNILGICLGMHIMQNDSKESQSGSKKGWKMFNNSVKSLSSLGCQRSVHTGWNFVKFVDENISYLDGYYYFSHSYAIKWSGDKQQKAYYVIDGKKFVAVIQNEKKIGVQFHPELSGKIGGQFVLKILGI
tara:strand:+ start:490 stop:1089 length:600 start_codon:yes stop_codon:yes gene_type:complete